MYFLVLVGLWIVSPTYAYNFSGACPPPQPYFAPPSTLLCPPLNPLCRPPAYPHSPLFSPFSAAWWLFQFGSFSSVSGYHLSPFMLGLVCWAQC